MITIDVQQDVLDGQPIEIAGTSAIIPNVVALPQAFRKAGQLVIHVVRIYKGDGYNFDLCRRELIENGAHLLPAGSYGCELTGPMLGRGQSGLDTDLLIGGGVQELGPNEVVIYKPRWGAFYATPIETYSGLYERALQELQNIGASIQTTDELVNRFN